jgi:hypothetical protein
MVIEDDVTQRQLAEFLNKLNEKELLEYKFIRGTFVKPTIAYDNTSFEDATIIQDEKKGDNLAQRIFAKYTRKGSLFENIENTV